MKVNLLRGIVAVFLIGGMLLCIDAAAQHEGLAPSDPPDPNHLEYVPPAANVANPEEKAGLAEHETRIIRDSLNAHNRSAGTAAHPKPGDKSTGKDDDDALSFNFLYYIIQKFKISDLIDE